MATTTSHYTAEGRAPPHFSWCVVGLLSACAFPRSKENLIFLVENGIDTLVSLTAEEKVDTHGVVINVIDIPVIDFGIPTLQLVETFLDSVKASKKAGKAVCVHCAAGRGRTGTMLGCYFVREKGMSPLEAVEHVRALRPGSIETADQEFFIYQFCRMNLTTDKNSDL